MEKIVPILLAVVLLAAFLLLFGCPQQPPASEGGENITNITSTYEPNFTESDVPELNESLDEDIDKLISELD